MSIARLYVLQKSLEKWTVHTTHLAELATSMYEAFAVNAKGISKNKDTQIQCAPPPRDVYDFDCMPRGTNKALRHGIL